MHADQFNDSWMKFVLTGQVTALADYIDAGGEIDHEVRHIICNYLRGELKPDNRGGKNHWSDYLVYVAVDTVSQGKQIGFVEACNLVGTTAKLNLDSRGMQRKYHRGKKLFETKGAGYVK